MAEKDISMTGVTKDFHLGFFQKKKAVDDVTFSIQQGEAVGLLGPNGAGKSTCMKMMIGLLQPTKGEIKICGQNAKDQHCRQFVGYLPENPRFQKFLSAIDILNYYGRLLGLSKKEITKRSDHLLEMVNLKQASKERTRGYSKGMIQRLAMAQALLSYPRLLIFDEPMSGLDPLGRMEIRKIIRDIHLDLKGSTIFFSTHILSDVEQVCTHVALLKKGKLKRHCSIEELLIKDKPKYEVVCQKLSGGIRDRLNNEYDLRESPLGHSVTLGDVDGLIEYLNILKSKRVHVVGVFSRRTSLEESLFGEPGNPSHGLLSQDTNEENIQKEKAS